MPRGRFVNRPYEILENQGLLACLFDSNCNGNGHTNHGVVTSADEYIISALSARLYNDLVNIQ